MANCSIVPVPGFMAGGTIAPARIVIVDTSADNKCTQSGANGVGFAISQDGQRDVPGLTGSDTTVAATAGDEIQLAGVGSTVLLTLGQTVVRGDKLESDSTGRGIKASATGQRNVIGQLLESGTTNNLCRVYVFPHQITN